MSTKKMPKMDEIFYCETCDFTCCKKSNYVNHLTTLKHKTRQEINTNSTNSTEKNNLWCQCGKSYKERSGLWRHKKICKILKIDETNDDVSFSEKEIMLQIVKQNQAIILENKEFKKMLIDMASSNKTNITNMNCNNNNKQFNLQFFLNETCKNAMNITDFVDSLEIKSGELEDLGKLGYIQGISNIFIRGLKELDEKERPLHCTDKKREILYIKDNNVWERETMDKMKMKKMISDIAQKNFKQIPKWKEENPLSEDSSSKKHFEYMQILCEVMTGITPDDENGLNKIIRSVANQVYLEK